jgi:hypothetical protein
MKKLEPGTKILIEVTVLNRAMDNSPDDECGYIVETNQGAVYVEPSEIHTPEIKKDRKKLKILK